jgi:hypothetical protein
MSCSLTSLVSPTLKQLERQEAIAATAFNCRASGFVQSRAAQNLPK